jgi:FkbM family methyltransferase
VNTALKSGIRRLVPEKHRQAASALLAKTLGTWWKSASFGYIDRTPLTTLLRNRLFEPELKLLPLLISGSGAAFDVGAHRGEYTYVLEKTAGGPRTYAIEPLPRLCLQLRRLFPDVNVMNLGLSDSITKRELKTPVIHGSPVWTRSTFEHFAEDEGTGAVSEEVPVLPLDLLCAQMHIGDVEAVKIDVEGHEKSVLLGAQNILRRCRPVLLVEIEQRRHAEPVEAIFSLIEGLGYEGFFFDCRAGALRSINGFSAKTHQQRGHLGSVDYVNNFFFLNKETALGMTESVNRFVK